MLRLEDGTVVVADRGANELRLFDAAGGFIRSLGGPGEGPGEFQLLNEVWTRGDTILVSDNIQSRISVFGRGGDVSTAPRYYDPAAWARYLRETPFPERMPLYRRLLVDAQRNLWAERYRPFRESEST